jgi:hypothetical protein
MQARKVFNNNSVNIHEEVKQGMLEEYIFHSAKKSPLLASLQFSMDSKVDEMHRMHCYSLKEIIQRKAFDIRY